MFAFLKFNYCPSLSNGERPSAFHQTFFLSDYSKDEIIRTSFLLRGCHGLVRKIEKKRRGKLRSDGPVGG
jgi:hypothetical protein